MSSLFLWRDCTCFMKWREDEWQWDKRVGLLSHWKFTDLELNKCKKGGNMSHCTLKLLPQ